MKAALYDAPLTDCLGYLLRRSVLLAAKLVGFKGFCLFLATVLLGLGKIGEDVWLTLTVTLVCSAGGLRVFDSLKEGTDALDARKQLAAKLRTRRRPPAKEEDDEDVWNAHGRPAGLPCLPAAAGGGSGGRPGLPAAPGSGDAAGQSGGAPSPGGGSSRQESSLARRRAAAAAGRAGSPAQKRAADKGHERIRAVLAEAAGLLE